MGKPTTGGSSARRSRRTKTGAKQARKKRRPGAFGPNDNRINRRGRPKKGETFSDIIRQRAEIRDVTNDKGARLRRKEAIVDKLYSKAIREGDFPSAKFLIERTDPPPGTETPEGEQTAAQVWQAVIAMVRKATEGHPAIRAKIVKELEAASAED